jgi:preprotein translocase subunit SecG
VLLTIPLVVLYVISSIALVALVLLHSGKGGGISDMFGGGIGAAASGSTVVERNLTRMTVLVSLVWFFLTLTLAIRL